MIMFRKYKGAGLVELLISLVVIAAIILMSVRYYQQASLANQVTATSGQIKRITEASFEFLQSCYDFTKCPPDQKTSISMTVLINQNLLTSQDQNSIWGGTITLSSGPSTQQIKITIPNVPTKACNSLNDALRQQNAGFFSGTAACDNLTNGYQICYPATNSSNNSC